MPKITVRKCPKTKKLFENDTAYGKHLVALRLQTNETRFVQRNRKRLTDSIRAKVAVLKSISEIEAYVADNFGNIMVAYHGSSDLEVHGILRETRLENLNLSVSYLERCSNTHRCPRDGVTNFSCDDDKPRGYPGWYGRITFDIANDPGVSKHKKLRSLWIRITDALEFVGIHTGTGGGGNPYSYDVTLFVNDFEALKKMAFEDALKGQCRW